MDMCTILLSPGPWGQDRHTTRFFGSPDHVEDVEICVDVFFLWGVRPEILQVVVNQIFSTEFPRVYLPIMPVIDVGVATADDIVV